jgi:hypothetical protein
MRCIILFFIFMSTVILHAQDIAPLQADRPDQTETPSIVPVGFFQIEAGVSKTFYADRLSSISLPAMLIKYGLTDRFEFRCEFEKMKQEANNVTLSRGYLPLNIGFKVALWNEKKWIPNTSFIFHYGLPFTASSDYKPLSQYNTFRFLMQHNLTDKLSFSYNLGAEWSGFTSAATGIYTVSASYAFTDKLGMYLEAYGFNSEDEKGEHLMDAGITYLVTNDVLLDFEGGTGIANSPQRYFIGAGLSFRFKTF